jgi:bifunctional non-homologous end joining protein LigD
MGLRDYLAKRKFSKTPEPKGTLKKVHGKKLTFVVQEHHASQLHYDFRLELDGVLKSWAVPKGPSMNPHDRHLAVRVEDHPYEYRTFEGTIPEGNYGAGNVIIWDEGTYEPYHDNPDDEETLRKELKKGHLTFIMHGKKLKGEFALIKMHDKDDEWLLIKKGDSFATDEDITQQNLSVISGKKIDETAPDLSTYPKVKEPWRVKPMLCTLTNQPFTKDDWIFEVKWDGYRAIGSKHGNKTALYSRANNDFSSHYPPIVEALNHLKHNVILDGEIVVTDKEGTPHFEQLQNWRRDPQGQINYFAFDILWYDGRDVRDMPLIERKQLLKSVIPQQSPLRYSDHVERNGEALFQKIKQRGLEGIVAKQASSPYREDNRGAAWLKIKTHLRQEVVIGGFTEPRGGRKYIGSLLVGVYDKGEFVYTGHSGGGIPDKQRKLLREKLERLERKTSPFSKEPKPNAPVTWVTPSLVCEMSFSEWTSDNYMRQPVYEGLRPDKKAADIHREKLKSLSSTKNVKEADVNDSVAFTHLDKVFFPKHGYTKKDMIQYYESVADYILPYLKDRPLSLLRQPNGIKGEGFFQKNMEHLPDWVPSVDIFSESNNADLHWIKGGELNTLLYMVQLGCVEINPWNSRVQHLDNPDWLVIDLDPEERSFNDVITVAQEVKKVCDEWHTPSLPKTSGKTGIHIYIPLGAKYSFEQSKNVAHLIALEVNKRLPKLTSIERMPEKRQHRIYLDFLQNRSGQTLAAPYSLRPTPDATVSTPLHWDEVKKGLKPTDFTIKNTIKRLNQVGDLWQPVLEKGIDLPELLRTIEKS